MNLARFHLVRHHDVTGTSGTGDVAEGVQYTSGRVHMVWTCPPATSACDFDTIADLLEIHGHHGNTVIRWLDPPLHPTDTPVNETAEPVTEPGDELRRLGHHTSSELQELAAVVAGHRRDLDARIGDVADGLAGELADLQTEVADLRLRAWLANSGARPSPTNGKDTRP